MKLELYKDAVLATDLPEFGLRKGDVVTLVDELHAADGSLGYAVEVFNAIGDTIDVHCIPATAVAPLREDEVFCVRQRTSLAA